MEEIVGPGKMDTNTDWDLQTREACWWEQPIQEDSELCLSDTLKPK